MSIIETHIPRDVAFLIEAKFEDWRLKVYGISTGSEPVSEELVDTGLNEILPKLPQPALTEDRYGVGFVIIHRGALRNWFSLDWWEHEDILFHCLFSSPLDNAGLVTAEESAAIACVHELKIINFENEAWINTALGKDGDPNFSIYLNKIYE